MGKRDRESGRVCPCKDGWALRAWILSGAARFTGPHPSSRTRCEFESPGGHAPRFGRHGRTRSAAQGRPCRTRGAPRTHGRLSTLFRVRPCHPPSARPDPPPEARVVHGPRRGADDGKQHQAADDDERASGHDCFHFMLASHLCCDGGFVSPAASSPLVGTRWLQICRSSQRGSWINSASHLFCSRHASQRSRRIFLPSALSQIERHDRQSYRRARDTKQLRRVLRGRQRLTTHTSRPHTSCNPQPH